LSINSGCYNHSTRDEAPLVIDPDYSVKPACELMETVVLTAINYPNEDLLLEQSLSLVYFYVRGRTERKA